MPTNEDLKIIFGPIPQATLFDTGVAAGSTDILAPDITLPNDGVIRVTVSENTGVVFGIGVTRAGVQVVMWYNAAVALTADALYMFDIGLRAGDIVNFQTSAATTLNLLNVDLVSAVGV